jgi:hypothetical protein
MKQPAGHHLAQLNIGRILYEIDDPRRKDFVDNLAFVNGLAERSPGFVWRYQDDSGNATSTRPYDGDPRMAVNMSVWQDVESLERFVWQTVHKRFYGRRHEWFETLGERYMVMWWVPAGQLPSVQEAIDRLEHLKAHGPSERAFSWENLASSELWKTSKCA